LPLANRIARFFLEQTYQNRKHVSNDHKTVADGRKFYQMAIKYSKLS
jgi:hypothetical protein